MKIVFTHWTRPRTTDGFTNCNKQVDYDMFMELSTLIAADQFDTVVVHTDDEGAKDIERLKLPVEILVTHNDFMATTDNPKQCWAYAKIYTYLLQTEPFAHIDFDVFLWDGIRKWVLGGDAYFQHWECKPYVWHGRADADRNNVKYPDWFSELEPADWVGACVGIIGYNDLNLCQFFANEAFEFIKNNIRWAMTGRNFQWIEQVMAPMSGIYKNADQRVMLHSVMEAEYHMLVPYQHIWGDLKNNQKILDDVREQLKQYKSHGEGTRPIYTGVGTPYTGSVVPQHLITSRLEQCSVEFDTSAKKFIDRGDGRSKGKDGRHESNYSKNRTTDTVGRSFPEGAKSPTGSLVTGSGRTEPTRDVDEQRGTPQQSTKTPPGPRVIHFKSEEERSRRKSA